MTARIGGAGVLLAVVAALSWLLYTPESAAAHANLVRSEPVANEVLEGPPGRVVVWFTEEIEPAFSKIEVLDSGGSRVDAGDSTVDGNNPTVMSVSLPPIPSGSYTVAWKNVSTVDGHQVRGSFVFSVGEALDPSLAGPDERPLLESPAEPFIRWLVLLGVLTLAGGIVFALVVALPGIEAASCGPQLSALLYRRWWAVTSAGVVAAAAGSLAHLAVQASSVAEVGVVEALGGHVVTVLADTTWGRLWLLRALALAAVAASLAVAYVWAGAARRPSAGVLLVAALPAGMMLLLSLSLASHAASTSAIRGPATLSDYLHLLASAAWGGGLAHFASMAHVALRHAADSESNQLLRAITPRFSVVAGLSVGLLIVTGLYGYWAQVAIPAALDTPYGLTLLAKIAMVAPLLLLGAANVIIVRPRLACSRAAALWLRRLVAAEAALVVLVLLAVGYLTSLEPARQVAAREGIGQPAALSFEGASEGVRIGLTLEPAWVGPNSIAVDLEDRLDAPIANATDVQLTLSYLDLDLGEEPASAEHTGNGRYLLEEALIGIEGAWEIEVLVRRPDAFDARTAFRFEVSAAGARSASLSPSPITGMLLLGIELAAAGVVFLVVGLPLGGWYSRRSAAIMVVGLLFFAAGAVAFVNGQTGPGDDAVVRNPFPPDAESLAKGLAVYQSACQICHGEAGRGDGPGAVGLDPPPGDLVVHVPLHPDRELYRFIGEGIPGTAMAPLGDRLTEDEIWHVINYIQTFE